MQTPMIRRERNALYENAELYNATMFIGNESVIILFINIIITMMIIMMMIMIIIISISALSLFLY